MRKRESGAAAVEFALVSSVFFVVLFGIIQYGLYFNDSLNVRQGIREAVRQGVVLNFDGTGPAAEGATVDQPLGKLQAQTKKDIGALTGPTYVKIIPPATWQKGAPLTVCAMVKSDGGIGLLPMPNDGWIRSRTQMSIEQAPPTLVAATVVDPLPSSSWDWCT